MIWKTSKSWQGDGVERIWWQPSSSPMCWKGSAGDWAPPPFELQAEFSLTENGCDACSICQSMLIIKGALCFSLSQHHLCFSAVSLFLKNWKKNYWDINHLPYYTQHCYEVSLKLPGWDAECLKGNNGPNEPHWLVWMDHYFISCPTFCITTQVKKKRTGVARISLFLSRIGQIRQTGQISLSCRTNSRRLVNSTF